MLLKHISGLDADLKCVIVGDAPYAEEYIDSLKRSAGDDSRIVFTGYVFGKGYHELGSNARIFVETSGVGGTHPALVEAMAFGNCVIAHNTPENLETIGEAGFAYDGKTGAPDLQRVLRRLLDDPDLIVDYAQRAQQRAQTVYTWESVTDTYEGLFYKLLGRTAPTGL